MTNCLLTTIIMLLLLQLNSLIKSLDRIVAIIKQKMQKQTMNKNENSAQLIVSLL